LLVKDLDISEAAKKILVELGYKSLYPPQDEAVKAGVLNNANLVLAIPTASGKTLVAELCMVKSVINGGKAIYLVPLRALASEKFEEFKKWEDLGIRVGLSTGDFDSSGSGLGKYDILVCTNEKADSLLRHHADWISKITVIIADEIHLINSTDRGPTLEVVLARLRQVNPSAQIIALSATISNAFQLAEWLEAELVLSDWRPVILKEGILHNGVINYADGSSQSVPLIDPELSICLAVDTIKNRGQALIFDSTRRNAVSIARRVSSILSSYLNNVEKKTLKLVARETLRSGEVTQISKQLASCIEAGVAFHHAGLNYSQRKLVEENFKNNLIKVVCATPTLAAGVNLPARRVIIRNYRRYDSNFGYRLIPVLEYKQMAGRAGRPKYDTEGESVLIAKNAGEENVLMERYIKGAPEIIESKLASESFLRTQILATIASDYANNRQGIMAFMEKTFYAHQFGSDFIEMILEGVLNFLFSEGMIEPQKNILVATPFGRRISELYIDPMSAVMIRDGLKVNVEQATDIGYLHLICHTPDMPRLYLGRRDYKELGFFADEHKFELRVIAPNEGDDPSEYEWFLSELKMTYLLERWISEVSEDQIISQFGVGSGDIFRFVETADWLLYATYEIAKLLNIKEEFAYIRRVRTRINYGVKEELLDLVKLAGVGRIRARRLYDAGLKNTRDLASVKIEELSKIPTIGKEIAKKIKKQLSNTTEDNTSLLFSNDRQTSLKDFK